MTQRQNFSTYSPETLLTSDHPPYTLVMMTYIRPLLGILGLFVMANCPYTPCLQYLKVCLWPASQNRPKQGQKLLGSLRSLGSVKGGGKIIESIGKGCFCMICRLVKKFLSVMGVKGFTTYIGTWRRTGRQDLNRLQGHDWARKI